MDILNELKMLNSFVDPRPRMTIEKAVEEITRLREELEQAKEDLRECNKDRSEMVVKWMDASDRAEQAERERDECIETNHDVFRRFYRMLP